jgi:hypothetical protein
MGIRGMRIAGFLALAMGMGVSVVVIFQVQMRLAEPATTAPVEGAMTFVALAFMATGMVASMAASTLASQAAEIADLRRRIDMPVRRS